MKQNYTDISVVLDRSGSMSSCVNDTIGGFNTFLREQKEAPGECTFTLVQFDDVYERPIDAKPIQEVAPLTTNTFVPRGSTALLDAIGRTINDTGARLAKLPENERPAHVIFVILTDGEENASKEFDRDQVWELITKQQNEFNWQILYLGAKQDAIKNGVAMGIRAVNTMSYSSSLGTPAAYAAASRNIGSLRAGATMDASFSVDDRKIQDEFLKKGS